MTAILKKVLKTAIPPKVRYFLWRMVPKLYLINTYVLRNPQYTNNIKKIADKYFIKQISWEDKEQLKIAHYYRDEKAFKNKVIPRLKCPAWVGFAVVDSTNNAIAYISWIVTSSITYLEEFGITLEKGQFLLKDGYCVPHYRHQGLHTRMEQKRINYCVENKASAVFIQIHESNVKGKESVLSNGYSLFKQNVVIHWPVFKVFRSFSGFIRNPFKKIVK